MKVLVRFWRSESLRSKGNNNLNFVLSALVRLSSCVFVDCFSEVA